MVLKANDRRTSCPCHDEFRGPRSDYVRQPETNTWCSEHIIMKPVDDVRNQEMIALLPEIAGYKGFLESIPPTFGD
ncbi:hypothetical protein TNCV_4920801 [Trichonephila clavipes]|nr:hypothetical protein TNCV_4920801 [Trichonephila clavipes]